MTGDCIDMHTCISHCSYFILFRHAGTVLQQHRCDLGVTSFTGKMQRGLPPCDDVYVITPRTLSSCMMHGFACQLVACMSVKWNVCMYVCMYMYVCFGSCHAPFAIIIIITTVITSIFLTIIIVLIIIVVLTIAA